MILDDIMAALHEKMQQHAGADIRITLSPEGLDRVKLETSPLVADPKCATNTLFGLPFEVKDIDGLFEIEVQDVRGIDLLYPDDLATLDEGTHKMVDVDGVVHCVTVGEPLRYPKPWRSDD